MRVICRIPTIGESCSGVRFLSMADGSKVSEEITDQLTLNRFMAIPGFAVFDPPARSDEDFTPPAVVPAQSGDPGVPPGQAGDQVVTTVNPPAAVRPPVVTPHKDQKANKSHKPNKPKHK